MHVARWLSLPVALFLVGGGVALADFKNLQVLPKSTSKDEMRAIMKAQNKALGVECDFCHEPPDMASDNNKKKAIARKMMIMTREINEKWIKGVIADADKHPVGCATCHQGHESPPPLPPAEPKK
jgi:hypothetical protein